MSGFFTHTTLVDEKSRLTMSDDGNYIKLEMHDVMEDEPVTIRIHKDDLLKVGNTFLHEYKIHQQGVK